MRAKEIPSLGSEWRQCSSIWGRKCGSGSYLEQVSPLDGSCIQKIRLIDKPEIEALLRPLSAPQIGNDTLRSFCGRLHAQLSSICSEILDTTLRETAFIRSDVQEVVSSCIEYVKEFPDYFESLGSIEPAPIYYDNASAQRLIRPIALPWGTVAAILPQSAFLYLALTCMLNAIAAGNRVILRAPTQSARSAALLGLAIERAEPPANSVSIVLVSAQTFMNALTETSEPILVHYLGSSAHAPDILSSCFLSGKHALIDGEGNTWVWVDEDFPTDHACDILTSGAIRYNGQTCTSINGAIIHPRVYNEIRDRLSDRWSRIKAGNPLEVDAQVGPLLHEAHAEECLARIEESGATLLAGGRRQRNLLSPTLAAVPREDSKLVCEGFFGAALWIAPGDIDRFVELWSGNRYPLCAGLLTQSGRFEQYIRRLSGAARICVNGDPSVEFMFEPWGGYPSSGTNPVSYWHQKYLRIVQVDHPA